MLKFRCKKCKYTFPIEQHPLYQNLREKLSDIPKDFSNKEKVLKLLNIASDITKQIRCQKCRSTVYYISIFDIKFDEGVDVTSEPLIILIKDLVDLHKKYKIEKTTAESFLQFSNEVSQYSKEILNKLIWDPGTLLYFEDSALISDAKEAIDDLWKNITEDELFDEMHSGGFGGLLVSLTGEYLDRVQMMGPTFITMKPSEEIKSYFQQAMGAWAHGLDTAALILTSSVLESTLKLILLRIDMRLAYDFDEIQGLSSLKERDFKMLINNSMTENILSGDEARKMHAIRKKRNAAVHKLEQISSDDTYKLIIASKELLEKLLAA